jgi:hypothetical protein
MLIGTRPFYIFSATYYSNEHDRTKRGNVTTRVRSLAQQYIRTKTNNMTVNNDLFTDTHIGFPKNLFVHVQDTVTRSLYKFVYAEGSQLDFRVMFDNLKSHLPLSQQSRDNLCVKIGVSIGEIVDKHSILEIKVNRMANEKKIADIRREMEELAPTVALIQEKHKHLYRMLVHVNTLIWDDTDAVKALLKNYDGKNFEQVSRNARLSNQIFANNQKRFRIKKIINDLYSSEVKEHKSYAEETCYLEINDLEDIYRKIPEINYLMITYDVVCVSIAFQKVFEQLFAGYPISILGDVGNDGKVPAWSGVSIDMASYLVWNPAGEESSIRDLFDFDPIRYVSGGRLGDFFNQLSVVCENYYTTGRKGILYISGTLGDPLVFGAEATHQDTFPIVSREKYIKEYSVHRGEVTEINLSSWRENLILRNWCEMYHGVFGVEWAAHRWITPLATLELASDFSNKILINTTPYRFPSAGAIQQLKDAIESELENCLFLSNEEEHYQHFVQQTGLSVAFCNPMSFSEMVKIIDSSKSRYFGFSSYAVIANALHKPHTLLGTNCQFDCVLNTMEGIVPHVLGMFR